MLALATAGGPTAPPQDPAPPEGNWLKRKFMAYPWHFAVGIGLVGIPLMRACFVFEPDPPPISAKLAAFSLVDTSGAAFGTDDLLGKVWVASFVAAKQADGDVVLERMKALQDRYAEAGLPVELVTFSADPAADTPERLAALAARLGADTSRWHFLTGSEADVDRLVAEGFRSYIDRTGDRVAHSDKMVLVDPLGHIRGYYPSANTPPHLAAQVVDELFWRAQHVLEEADLK